MKYLTLLITAFAAVAATNPVTPDSSNSNIVSFQYGDKFVWGEPAQSSLGKRSEQCRTSESFAFGAKCTPGDCDCAGENGCWCWPDQPYCKCMCAGAEEGVDCNGGIGNPQGNCIGGIC